MKPIVITDVSDEESLIPFALPGGLEFTVPRMDFLDEPTFDAMNAALVALDVEQQVIAVANDIAAAAVGTKLKWQPLLDDAKGLLVGLGVEITRVVDDEGRHDEVVAPSRDVVAALKPYSDERPLPLRKRGREIALAMLRHVVDEDTFAAVERLRVGQLDFILAQWRKHSNVTLGESEGSASS